MSPITPFRPAARIRNLYRWITCWAVFLTCVNLLHGDEIRVSYAMDSDPLILFPPVTWRLPEGSASLWRQALAGPEAEYQLRVSESVARAHSEGLAGMDALEPDLLRILSAEATHPAARFAAARAIIVLDTQDASELLFHVAQEQSEEFRLLIEPVLAAWDYEPARDVWLQRLMNPESRRRELILAAECAGRVRDPAAIPRLLEIVRAREQSADIRLVTARAAGAITDTGLEEDAAVLAAGAAASIVDRLCAVALLTRHTSNPAQQTLTALGADAEPSIAAAALEVLLSIDPELVLPLVPQSLASSDANVRMRGAEAYIALPTPERVVALSHLLDDPHTGVRANVRDALYAHSEQPELDLPVRESTMQVLAGESWRGQEQAALLLATLGEESAAARMIELLESDRPEVMIATAWGLRMLAIPETAAAMLDKADRQTAVRMTLIDPEAIDQQVAHLFEALALVDYREADPLMRRYIPKNGAYGEVSRGAAIWALGHLYAAEANDELAAQFMARATDPGLIPEWEIVQLMSLVSIGRMEADSQLSRLRELLGPEVNHGRWDYTIRWAIQQMAEDETPLAPPVVRVRDGWFLEPLEE